MGTENLSLRRLQTTIRKLLASGFAGGSGQLFRIEQLAWTCHANLDGPQKLICAGIARLFGRIAKHQEGQAVTADEAVRICNAVSQPLLRCLDALAEKGSGASPEQLLSDLDTAYEAGIANDA